MEVWDLCSDQKQIITVMHFSFFKAATHSLDYSFAHSGHSLNQLEGSNLGCLCFFFCLQGVPICWPLAWLPFLHYPVQLTHT